MANHSTEKPKPLAPSTPASRWPRLFIGVIGVAFLFTIFVLIKKSHAQSEWERYQKELTAAGEHLDWDYFIRPEIKNEENFYAAPAMQGMFQKKGAPNSITNRWDLPENDRQWDALKDKEPFVRSPNNVTYPVSIVFQWEKDQQQLLQLFFTACQRPKARLLTDFKNPMTRDMPNFVSMRLASQSMATLAKAHIITGHPEKAMPYLAGIHRLRQVLDSGQTVVEAMINVALSGIYVEVIRDGLAQNAWSDEQLRALQKQLLEMNCLPGLAHSLRAEVAAVLRTIEIVPARDFLDPYPPVGPTLWEGIEYEINTRWRGLMFSSARENNLLNYTQLMISQRGAIEDKSERVYPKKCAAFTAQINSLNFSSRDNILAAVVIPNLSRACETAAKNQTLLEEAALGCALELFRRNHGHFPETLQELCPTYFTQLPHDIITGEPLHYRRTAPDAFTLYAVGWDELDDGGIPTDWVWTRNRDFTL